MTHVVSFYKWCSTHHTLSYAAQRTQHTPQYAAYCIAFNSIRFYPIHHYNTTHSLYNRSHQSSILQWIFIHNKEKITYSSSSGSKVKVKIISAMRNILESRAGAHHCVRCVCVYGQCGHNRSLIHTMIHPLTHHQSINQSVSRAEMRNLKY